MLAVYHLFGIFLGTVNPPITNTAVSGMPASMAGVAASLASAGRQTGVTLGVAISGTIVGPALTRGGTAFTSAAHGVWWLLVGLGAGVLVQGLVSTGRRALRTAGRAAALFRGWTGARIFEPAPRPAVADQQRRDARRRGRCSRRTAGNGWLLGLAVRARERSVAITGQRT